MADSVNIKKSLSILHEKQDKQTDKLSCLEIAIAKQETATNLYAQQSDRMANELSKMNDNLANYNAELKVHIAGVMELKETNRLMREENDQRSQLLYHRLEIAEKPIKWIQVLGKLIPWLASAAGLLVGLSKILKVW